MISIGFDLSFIDTVVRLENNKGNLVDYLPEPGYHHRTCKITRVAGGNGVNIAYVLDNLGIDYNLIIPSNSLFDQLLAKRDLIVDIKIHDQINETVAVLLRSGDIQLNQTKAKLDRTHWTKSIHNKWIESSHNISLNWGLNLSAKEWISCQWLASCGWKFDEIIETDNLINTALEETNLSKPFILEPGSMKDHHDSSILLKLLNHISNQQFKNIYPIFLCNEEESKEFSEINFSTKIIHKASNVILESNLTRSTYKVPKLENIVNLVGAGDAFLGGIISSLVSSNEISIENAISVAQKYITRRI